MSENIEFSLDKMYSKKVLYDALKKLEKEKSEYYGFLKKYIFGFDKNSESTNYKMKKVFNYFQKQVYLIGYSDAMKNLALILLSIKNKNEISLNCAVIRKIKGERLYFYLLDACKNNSLNLIMQKFQNLTLKKRAASLL